MHELPYRQIHLDFHTSPYIPTGDYFNEDEFIASLKKAHVNSINLFAKCHHGMYYYPSKLGDMHPKLNFDLFGTQVKACQKNGIRVSAYTSVAWNEVWADNYPECLQINFNGISGAKKPFDASYDIWRNLCLNSEKLIEYIKKELKEIYDNYHTDGYWMDIIFQKNCICGNCRRRMLSNGLDPEIFNDVLRNDREVVLAFMKTIYEHIKSFHPDGDIYFNSMPYDFDMANDPDISTSASYKYFSFFDIESLPSDYWGYSHFPISAAYLGTQGKEITMMNGKFHSAWGDFGSLRTRAALEYECFRGLAYGAKVCVGDQMHPCGKLDESVYERIGEVFHKIKQKEDWCRGTKKLSEAGVFITKPSLYGSGRNVDSSIEGVYRILTENGTQFDLIDYNAELSKYELLILPDEVYLTDKAADKINSFVENGGSVLITGGSGLDWDKKRFLINEIGVKYIGRAEYAPRYMRITKTNFLFIPPMDYVAYLPGIDVEPDGGQILSETVEPHFNRSWNKFCSHRQTPPRLETSGKPAITQNGGIIYIVNPLFSDYSQNGNEIFKLIITECVSRLLKKPLVKTEGLPAAAEALLRKQGDDFVLHLLSYNITRRAKAMDTIDDYTVVNDAAIMVKTGFKPRRVSCAPDDECLSFEFENGYTKTVLPKLEGHAMIKFVM